MASGNIAGTHRQRLLARSASNAPSSGHGAPPTAAKAARPTTSTPRRSPKRRAAWAWRPAAPTRTSNTTFAADENGGVDRAAARHVPLPVAQGLRRVLRLRAPRRLQVGRSRGAGLDPAARPTSPRPNGSSSSTRAQPSFARRTATSARAASYTCRVEVAPGAQPNNAADAPPAATSSRCPPTYCDGTTVHSRAVHTGCSRTSAPRRSRRCSRTATRRSFTGNENGGRLAQTSNGRPNTLPYAFTVRVVVTTAPRRARARR